MNLEGAKSKAHPYFTPNQFYRIDNIGNYKGVMLCTRPNEAIGQPKEK